MNGEQEKKEACHTGSFFKCTKKRKWHELDSDQWKKGGVGFPQCVDYPALFFQPGYHMVWH